MLLFYCALQHLVIGYPRAAVGNVDDTAGDETVGFQHVLHHPVGGVGIRPQIRASDGALLCAELYRELSGAVHAAAGAKPVQSTVGLGVEPIRWMVW